MVHLESGVERCRFDRWTDIPGGYPLPEQENRVAVRSVAAGLLAVIMVAGGCKSGPVSTAPRTIEPARAAESPPTTAAPAGQILPLAGNPQAAVVDGDSLVVLAPGGDSAAPATLTVFGPTGAARTIALPDPATAITSDGRGTAYAAGRGGVITVDLAAGRAGRTAVPGAENTDFTAIARRADSRLVLGGADGSVRTLNADMTVAAEADGFARVDGLAALGDTAVVLDRGQTSVTELDADGSPGLALRAGLGATTITADPVGRVLVADTRGGQLLVFGVDPLIERQAYPVGDSPYGIAGSRTLVWVALTSSNTVVGYDLATGIPVEKVRYPTVRQPNALAYDEVSGTLYVVSGSGAGVQVIRNAGVHR